MSLPKILFEDEELLVLDKPPGLPVDALVEILQKDFNIRLDRGGLAHRLDKDTSGILLVAKTARVLANLQKHFKERKIKKQYLALVHGTIAEPGKVTESVGRNPGNREKFSVILGGKEAETEYEPLKRLQVTGNRLQEIFSDLNKIQFRKLSTIHYNLFTLVACRPKTGRTHQIRVHLKYIRHPVVADDKYAGRKINRLDRRWCPRMFLHAAKIGFVHPLTGDWMEIESPLPEDLKKALGYLS